MGRQHVQLTELTTGARCLVGAGVFTGGANVVEGDAEDDEAPEEAAFVGEVTGDAPADCVDPAAGVVECPGMALLM
jgi:hypothetical protein